MVRKICAFCLALAMISFMPKSHAQRGKSEIAVGYGYYSFYSFVNHGQNNAGYSTSSGTGCVTYRYYLSQNVTLGMGVGYENISTWGSFLTFAPEVTVKYLDTRHDYIRVRLYGAFSWGISVLADNSVKAGDVDESGPKPWAFQATPIGMRIGRQFAGFVELGLGYKGLVHGGMELRFPQILPKHRHMEDNSEDKPEIESTTENK